MPGGVEEGCGNWGLPTAAEEDCRKWCWSSTDYDGNGDPTDDCPYDYLTVNGKKYCGTSGPDGVASDGTIIWTAKSDSWCANEGSCEGWQLCWECPPCTESARQVLFAPYVAPAAHATAAAFDECC